MKIDKKDQNVSNKYLMGIRSIKILFPRLLLLFLDNILQLWHMEPGSGNLLSLEVTSASPCDLSLKHKLSHSLSRSIWRTEF